MTPSSRTWTTVFEGAAAPVRGITRSLGAQRHGRSGRNVHTPVGGAPEGAAGHGCRACSTPDLRRVRSMDPGPPLRQPEMVSPLYDRMVSSCLSVSSGEVPLAHGCTIEGSGECGYHASVRWHWRHCVGGG